MILDAFTGNARPAPYSLLHQRSLDVDLAPQQRYLGVSPDKISSER